MTICPCSWFAYVRSALEILYFLSGIGITVAAFIGLRQITVTRQIARTNARRESINLASAQCRYFAEMCVPALVKFLTEYNKTGATFLQQNAQFQVNKGQLTTNNFDIKKFNADAPKINQVYIAYLNTMETFAIPFAAGVADEKLGYEETVFAFLEGSQVAIPGVYALRTSGKAKFASLIRLFELWNNRLVAEAMAPHLKPLQDIIKAAEKGKIDGLGFDF